MGLFDSKEKKECMAFIKEWEWRLNHPYREAWQNRKRNIDIVAKAMQLTDTQKALVLRRDLAWYVGNDYKKRIGFDQSDASKQRVINTKGTTKTLELISKMADEYKLYNYKCSSFIEEYCSRMQALENPRR